MLRSSGAICIVALAALVALNGCAGREQVPRHLVRVEVEKVGLDPDGDPFVLLQERGGDRLLPIMVDEAQARAIATELQGSGSERPLTYDLMRKLLQSTGNRVDRVVVDALNGETYHARIELDGGRLRVDSRPSDAIALALAAKAPIYVFDVVFDAGQGSAAGARSTVPGTGHGLGLTVQDLSVQMAPYFKAAPGSAVVIADFSPADANSGVDRGDLLTAIGATRIHDVSEFRRTVAGLVRGSYITVTLRHSEHDRQVTLRRGGP